MKGLRLGVLLIALPPLLGGCGGGGGGASTGSLLGTLSVLSEFDDATRTVPGYADTLRVTVTPPAGETLPGSFPNPFLLTRADTSRQLDDLAPSTSLYVLDMEALTDGTVVGTVQRSVVVSAGEVREVVVSANLQSAVDSVTVEGATDVIVGNDTQFTAFAKDDQGATLFSGAGFAWTSSDPDVLTVDPDTGLATASKSGTATVTAVLSGTALSGQLVVTVDIDSKIVFASNRDGSYDLYVMKSDGTGVTQLTNAVYSDEYPGFSPDGSKILFSTTRNGVHDDIYVMNSDGTGLTQLTNDPTEETQPTFSPDGSKILFVSDRNNRLDLFIMNADGTGAARVGPFNVDETDPAFSPDGSKFAFVANINGNRDIYVMNIDGTGLTRLTTVGATDLQPSFSPDGSKIAFMSIGRNGGREIYVMNADGSGQTNLTDNPAVDTDPSFSPDGSRIAFSSNRDGNSEIYLMNADGTGVTRLTDNAFSDGDPAFPLLP